MKSMSLLAHIERQYDEHRRNKWLRRFAVFCRVVLALGFIPAAFVKLNGERFTGLPSNNPLGHYFDALLLTGFYYTFIGVSQIVAALLLLIPRTALVGALVYFPIILNIFVLTHATRFDGTRIVTLMLLANVFLLLWDIDRLKHLFSNDKPVHTTSTGKIPFAFFAIVLAIAAAVIVGNFFLFDIRPGNEEAACRNGTQPGDARHHFCDCIWTHGKPLNACLNEYRARK